MRGLLLVLALALPSPASAGGIYAIDSAETLFEIDPTTGEITPLSTIVDRQGNSISGFFVGIDSTPGGSVYGVTINGDLYRIDLGTSQATWIGNTGLPVSEGDLSFDPTSGSLFVIGGDFSQEEKTVPLFTVDLATGASSLVGLTGIHPADLDPSGLVFSPSGELFALDTTGDRILRLDPLTAQPLGEVPTELSALSGLVGLDYDPVSDRFLAWTANELWAIDPTTGDFTEIGGYRLGTVISGLTVVPEPAAALLVAFGGVRIAAQRLRRRVGRAARAHRATPS